MAGVFGIYSCNRVNSQLLSEVGCDVDSLINDPLYREYSFAIDHDLLPIKDQIPSAPVDPTLAPDADRGVTYVAGDRRTIENARVFLIHIYWLRQHNKKAVELVEEHPTWSDEELYRSARRYYIALWRHFMYDELLPIIIGRPKFNQSPLKRYDGYDPTVDPRVNNASATAAMRWGHSTIPREFFTGNLTTGEKITRTRQQQTTNIHSPDNPVFSEYLFVPVGGQGVDRIESSDWLAYYEEEENLLGGLIHGRGNRVDEKLSHAYMRFKVGHVFNFSTSLPI